MADIGGTHARFAVAKRTGGSKLQLDQIVTLKTADHISLEDAWATYTATLNNRPCDAAIAVAASAKDSRIALTNAHWELNKSEIAGELGLRRYIVINDFGAVGHAVANLDTDAFDLICGPDIGCDQARTVSIVGPGTGLGVAHIGRTHGSVCVTETEGGHIGFAPHDEFEDRLLHHLRQQHTHVSVERVVSGSGLRAIYEVIAGDKNVDAMATDDRELWHIALSGEDVGATEALARYCGILGSIAGDIALVQGADMLVLAGGLGQRLSNHLAASEFAERFCAKGRFSGMMESISVKQLNYPEAGLYGAAAAFFGS